MAFGFVLVPSQLSRQVISQQLLSKRKIVQASTFLLQPHFLQHQLFYLDAVGNRSHVNVEIP